MNNQRSLSPESNLKVTYINRANMEIEEYDFDIFYPGCVSIWDKGVKGDPYEIKGEVLQEYIEGYCRKIGVYKDMLTPDEDLKPTFDIIEFDKYINYDEKNRLAFAGYCLKRYLKDNEPTFKYHIKHGGNIIIYDTEEQAFNRVKKLVNNGCTVTIGKQYKY